MKKSLLPIACLLFVSGFAQKFPTDPVVKNLIQPVRLNRDTTILYLTDYFVAPEKIDSISSPPGLQYSWRKTSSTLSLISKGNQPPVQDLKLWSGGHPYAIILKKSEKELYKFSFNPKGINYNSVQLAGELNDWNPKRTPFTFKNGVWQAEIELNPGIYQYQLVINDKWMLDPANPDSADNNNGGFNSVFKAGNSSLNKPVLRTGTILKESFSVKGANLKPENSVKFYWQNFRLGNNFIKASGDSFIVSIPEPAKLLDRSFIRIFADKGVEASNDLLIPLQGREVLRDSKNLTRNDKEANRMYFVLVDRFMNGDSANDKKVVHPEIKPKANYYGGDLAGVLQKINQKYFDELHMNALWISPIVQNPETAYKEFPEPHDWYSGYHGYWPISLTMIDHRFGNDQVFTKMVDAAHTSKMNVYLDLVANHVHEEYSLIKKHPEWQTQLNLADGRKNIRLWDEQRLTTWFDNFLPTLDFSKPEVVKLEVDSSIYWIRKFGIDGFRHDATKHIPENFWRALTLELKTKIEIPQKKSLYQLGETYGSKELIGSYIGSGMMDGQFDFNLYFDARAAFAKDDVGLLKLVSTLKESLNHYGYHHLMGNISGNHDIPRFTSLAGGALSFSEDARTAGWQREVGVGNPIAYDKFGCMLAFMTTIPGVPVLYYGDEIGMPGAGDPDNRRMMKFDNLTKEETTLKQKVATLFGLRENHLSLVYGDLEWVKTNKNLIAFTRKYFNETVLVVINNDTAPATFNASIPNLKSARAEFGSKFTGNGNLSLELKPKSFEVFTIGKN